jgi:hypothetical protein
MRKNTRTGDTLASQQPLAETVASWTVQPSTDPDDPTGWDLLDEDGDVYDSGRRSEMIAEANRLDRRDQIGSLRESISERLDELDDDDTQAVLDRLTAILGQLRRGNRS